MSSNPTHDTRLTRRSLVTAAAWSAPVIAATAATPFAAASQCPEVGSIAQWTGPTVISGAAQTNEPDYSQRNYWRPYVLQPWTGWQGWFSGANNQAVAPSTSLFEYSMETSFMATAGFSYEVWFIVSATELSPAYQHIHVDIDGQTEFRIAASTTTIAGYDNLPEATPKDFRFTHVADRTGPVTIKYTFTVQPRMSSGRFDVGGRNTDMRIAIPKIRCL